MIGAVLKIYVNETHDDWDSEVQSLAFAYRTSVIEGLPFSPFELLYGRPPSLPTDVLYGERSKIKIDEEKFHLSQTARLREAFDKMKVAQNKINTSTKERYDKTQVDVSFKEGDLVLIYNKSPYKPGLSGKLLKNSHYLVEF